MPEDVIRNPANPDHWMALQPVKGMVLIMAGREVLIETRDALRCVEVGKKVYDPVLYVPLKEVKAGLGKRAESTHCPLKGEASYFDWIDQTGAVRAEKIAWAYLEPHDFAKGLAGRCAFYTDGLTVVRAPG